MDLVVASGCRKCSATPTHTWHCSAKPLLRYIERERGKEREEGKGERERESESERKHI